MERYFPHVAAGVHLMIALATIQYNILFLEAIINDIFELLSSKSGNLDNNEHFTLPFIYKLYIATSITYGMTEAFIFKKALSNNNTSKLTLIVVYIAMPVFVGVYTYFYAIANLALKVTLILIALLLPITSISLLIFTTIKLINKTFK